MWIFHRQHLNPAPQPIAGLKALDIGEDGSRTQVAAQVLLTGSGINAENSTFDIAAPDAAAAKLGAGELDTVELDSRAAALLVTKLHTTPDIEQMSNCRAGAFLAGGKLS